MWTLFSLLKLPHSALAAKFKAKPSGSVDCLLQVSTPPLPSWVALSLFYLFMPLIVWEIKLPSSKSCWKIQLENSCQSYHTHEPVQQYRCFSYHGIT